jgi:tetraacyldisaccharide 4'-kinase
MRSSASGNRSRNRGRPRRLNPVNSSPLPPLLRWSGPALAAAYGVGVRLHRACSSPQISPLPTLCIGNITTGGTGKTPASAYVARGLARRGRKPAVLMRGYKDQGLDEAAELNATLADLALPSPVIVNSDRLSGARLAKEKGCDTVVLDDGFQHWRLKRDLDIVLIDATDPFSQHRLLPYGKLREHPRGLARAGALIITRSDCVSTGELSRLRGELAGFAPRAVIALARHAPKGLRALNAAPAAPRLKGLKLVAACGIGNPDAFRQTLNAVGAEICGFVAFSDHHRYAQSDVDALVEKVTALDAHALVVTEKDSAKLVALKLPTGILVAALSVEFEVTDGEDALWKCIDAALARR